MKTVIVSGALANKPFNGGNAWTRLSWTRAFERLGLDVWFVEQIDAAACTGADGKPAPFEASVNRQYFRDVTDRFGPAGGSALVCRGDGDGDCPDRTEGVEFARLVDVAASADLLFNISGHLSLEPLKRLPRLRVYFDDDPGYTQFWHAAGSAGPRLEGHDLYYTVGRNIGSPDCPIPTGGISWLHVPPPVVLDDWPLAAAATPAAPAPPEGRPPRFTTVASWRGPYGPVQHAGKTYGLKAHEFRKFVTLPRLAEGTFEIALDIDPADDRDLTMLHANRWRTVNPRSVAATPEDFRRYVQGSDAEFSAAQGVYVDTHSGWFSDRTTRYLASGKPALVQDTGFGRHLGAGEGLVPFRTLEEACAGAADIARRYDHHSRAARAVAVAHFDSDKVVGRLLDEVGGSRGRR